MLANLAYVVLLALLAALGAIRLGNWLDRRRYSALIVLRVLSHRRVR